MNFTSKAKLGLVASGILTIVAATTLIGWARHLNLAPAPTLTMRDAFTRQDSIRTRNHQQIDHKGVALTQSPDLRTDRSECYQTIAWYNSKHWWKKHAPIVGGAAGGKLIGGLAGGGTGAIIGGAAGGDADRSPCPACLVDGSVNLKRQIGRQNLVNLCRRGLSG